MGQGHTHQQKSEGKDSSRTPKTLLGKPEWVRGHENRPGLQGAQHGCGHGAVGTERAQAGFSPALDTQLKMVFTILGPT